MLNIEELAKIYQKELQTPHLLELPDDFFEKIGKYLVALEREQKGAEGLKKELVQEQLRETALLLDLLYQARMVKAMIQLATGETPDTLIAKERNGFLEIKRVLGELHTFYERGVVEKKALMAPISTNRVLVIFQTDLKEKILGVDAKVYGPFKTGDVVNLPAPNAELLLRHGIVKKIKIGGEE